jgi:hypothetical protein
MTARIKWSAALIGLYVLSGCQASTLHTATEIDDDKRAVFCDIVGNPEKYRDAKVELRARYLSDGKHEEVLEELFCSHGRRIIDIGRRSGSDSVAKFYAERARICSERGAFYLCNTSAKVEVAGVIRVMSGEWVLDIEEIRDFDFD